MTGSPLSNSGQAACLWNSSFAGSYYCRHYYSRGAHLGFLPVFPSWFASPGYETDQSAAEGPEAGPDPLTEQVGDLTAEVEMLNQSLAQQNSQAAPSAAPPAEAEEKPPATVLVYRDGHEVEVQDYAIQGQTLWVFSGQLTQQVPLADLDLAATQRVNGQRGVEFVPPNPQ